MVVGVIRLDLRLFDIQSLKQKRSVVSRLLNRLRSRFPVSIAEVGHLGLLQRTFFGGAMTAADTKSIQAVFRKLENDIYASGQVEIIALDCEYIHVGEDFH